MQKLAYAIAVVFVLLGTATGRAADLQWSSKNCVTVDGSFYLCKPDDKWDTQKTEESSRPLKFVYHKGGANFVVWYGYDQNVTAKSADDYAGDVRARYETRGVKVEGVTKDRVEGRDVYTVGGLDTAKNFRYMMALFYRPGFSKTLQLEFVADAKDASAGEPQFRAFVQSVKDLR